MTANDESVFVTGLRPTGPLHLGNYVGAVQPLLELQKEHDLYVFVADLHALTTQRPDQMPSTNEQTNRLLAELIACGVDPESVTLFVQSDVGYHERLFTLLSMITSEGRLRRNPTYQEQQDELGRNQADAVGFLTYPVLQAADVLLYEATHVPVGEDQLPHVELLRDLVDKLNNTLGADLQKPEPYLSDTAKLLGTDGERKMSASYNNAIDLTDGRSDVTEAITTARTDAGPEGGDVPTDGPVGNLFTMLQEFGDEACYERHAQAYRDGTLQYHDLKTDLADQLNGFLDPIRTRADELLDDGSKLQAIREQGADRARSKAADTYGRLRDVFGLSAT